MNRYAWCTVIMGAMIASGAWAQEEREPQGRPMDDVHRQVMMRMSQLDIQEREAALNFKRQMDEMKLQEEGLKLEQLRPGGRRGGPYHGEPAKAMGIVVAACLLAHILLAVWVYTDIRKRKAGSGIWIAVTLLVGFFGALPYAVVRLGDLRASGPPGPSA